MKKLLILFLVSMIGLTGCGVKEDENGLKITREDKREEVGFLEYGEKYNKIMLESNRIKESYSKEYREEHARDSDSFNSWEDQDGGIREYFKYSAEQLSTFKPKDKELNELHNKAINVMKDIYINKKDYIEYRPTANDYDKVKKLEDKYRYLLDEGQTIYEKQTNILNLHNVDITQLNE
jgi:hypothetical protein